MRRPKSITRAGALRLPLIALLCAGLPAIARAQDLQDRPVPPPANGAGAPAPATDDEVTFSAAQLDYDDNANFVTATGDVRMLRAGNRLRADKVTWNRTSGEVRASGNVALVNPGGDTAYADDILLTDEMHDGIADNMLLVLSDGGRLAARHGERKGDITTLSNAAYTPCAVVDGDCPKDPSWQITAVRVIHNDRTHRISYKDARIHMFGLTVLALPGFSHPDGSGDGGGSGLLMPDLQYSKATGVEFKLPYYFALGPNRDLTLTPHLYTAVLPALEGTYRSLDSRGAFQVRAMATYGSRLPASINANANQLDKDDGPRGFIDANGRYQFSPYWTVSGAIRLETDRTFMKRYDISNDDRLRSTLRAERIDANSYLSIAGWYVQTVRSGEAQGQQPIALPEIDYRRRIADPLLGGTFQLQLNSLALTRTGGQDTQRAFAGLRWDLRRLTSFGQEITLTAYGRVDAYHTEDSLLTSTVIYRGLDGWHDRALGALAADMRWPLIGTLFGGTQQIVPRIQIVGTPHVGNIKLPNEDSRAIDLEDSNLFALNRFSGYDRWEDSSRITYGGEYSFDRPHFSLRAIAGQSYRLATKPTILPSGTGLSDRFSDYVGRVTVKYGSFVEITERFRLDKDNLAVRRNEIDASIGTSKTYVLLGYLRLNRNIDTSIEDLRDRSEIRAGGRMQLTRYWSIFGSTVIDLTSKSDDPLSLSDGFSPVRHRLGITYSNECLELGVTYRRDYDPTGDARRGSTFSLRLALKNVGR